METLPSHQPDDEQPRPERTLTAEQMDEFRVRVAQKLQLAAQRAQSTAQPIVRGISYGTNNHKSPIRSRRRGR